MLYVETLKKNQTFINGTCTVFNRYQLINYPHFVNSKMSLKSIHPHLHKPSWQLGALLPPFPFLSLPGVGKGGREISNIAGFFLRLQIHCFGGMQIFFKHGKCPWDFACRTPCLSSSVSFSKRWSLAKVHGKVEKIPHHNGDFKVAPATCTPHFHPHCLFLTRISFNSIW